MSPQSKIYVMKQWDGLFKKNPNEAVRQASQNFPQYTVLAEKELRKAPASVAFHNTILQLL